MLPGERFNELYNMLDDIIHNRCLGVDVNKFHIPYWDEIACVEVRLSDNYKTIRVTVVQFSDGTPDYGYFRGKEPELISWLLRPDVNRCVQELEKTIFMLS
jgi:hypothetical protein